MTRNVANNEMAEKGRLRRAGWLFAGALALVSLPGCDTLFDVDNPNNLVQEDLDNPAAAEALANGGLVTVTRGISYINTVYATAADELQWVGSRDAWNQLSAGNLTDPANEFLDAAYPYASEARWMAAEAVRKLEEFDAAGDLGDPTVLGRAYVYAGLIYASLADAFDDFVFSDRKTAEPPIGETNMSGVYDQAIGFLDQALAIARSEGDSELETRALAVRARAKFGKAVWAKVNPAGTVNTASPLVNDGGANSDAAAVVGLVGVTNDWRWQLKYSSATVVNDTGDWVNDRSEMSIGPAYVDYEDPEEQRFPESVILLDPIDQIPDPVADRTIFDEFIAGGRYPPLTAASAREMHLILAEAGLAQGDMDQFTLHVNHVRAMDDLTPYSGQVDAQDLLDHERRVNLFMQLRRITDHYRFADPSPQWLPSSEAITRPGTFLPIAITEIRANEFIQG